MSCLTHCLNQIVTPPPQTHEPSVGKGVRLARIIISKGGKRKIKVVSGPGLCQRITNKSVKEFLLGGKSWSGQMSEKSKIDT